MTKDDEDKFQKAKECHICEKECNKTDVIVRDHCHITGKYRGSAHQDCNLNFRITDKIPVIFHNLRGYDSHFIMQEIGEIVKNHTYTNKKGEKCQINMNAIPNNMEKYMALMLGNHLTFIDSYILLLADVFENFQKTCVQYYKLDPCHYFTSPELSWDAMLKMTDIKLELMTDVDMFQFIEKGMRGGISYIANRYGKANNKYMKIYDEKAPSKYIMYLDANNLYGWAMSQYLPTGGFRWMTKKQIYNTNLAKYKEDSKTGLILEVDLEYPEELHNLHNDYPLAAEKTKVGENMLSKY